MIVKLPAASRGLTWILSIFIILTTAVYCKKDNGNPSDPNNPPAGGGTPDPTLKATTSVTDNSGNVYEVGSTNPSGNNKIPWVRKKDAGGNQLWKVEHEATPVDGTATIVVLDANQNPWVVFTVDGGSNDAGAINKKEIETGAFEGVLFNNYGNGGGPKVCILARLNPANGKIAKGTFLMSRLDKVKTDDGPHFSGKSINDPNTKTNTFNVTKVGITADQVTIEADNTFYPPDPTSTQGKFVYYTNYKTVGTGKIRYTLPLDLSKLLTAEILQNP